MQNQYPHKPHWPTLLWFYGVITLLNLFVAFTIVHDWFSESNLSVSLDRLEQRARDVELKLRDTKTRRGITQVATIDSLLAGVYDGEMTLEELGRYGNFGIGTFDRLDGEMVLLDGVFYQVKGTGQIVRPKLDTTTPFASVFAFPEDADRLNIDEPLDHEALCKRIDTMAPNMNVPVAVRLDGRFSNVKTRSVPAQEKPYKPLVEVTKNQPEFELGTLEGTVVGFRLPPYVRGVNVPGYHLHFLCTEQTRGGHLLQMRMDSGFIAIAPAHRLQIVLPQRINDFSQADLAKDRSEELEKVEK